MNRPKCCQGGSDDLLFMLAYLFSHEDTTEFPIFQGLAQPTSRQHRATLWDIKQQDFNFPAPLDMTNISVNYDDSAKEFFRVFGRQPCVPCSSELSSSHEDRGTWVQFQLRDERRMKRLGTLAQKLLLRMTLTYAILAASISAISRIWTNSRVLLSLASKFLVCGTLRADLPYAKVYQVREKNRRLGLGLMGIHEWLLKRGQRIRSNSRASQMARGVS